ncbi:MAG: hypothetical protein HOP29_13820 [Phycisphaerales bacterium]|nr:hypothetical protein [Phycisphaerales bacterium]
MIEAISSYSGAVHAANAMLRELGSARAVGRGGESERVSSADGARGARGKSELTEEERREVEKLKERDAEVRRHESAHKAAAGSAAKGGPQFEYATGPDGRRYATGGEVQIDTSEVPGDPQATIAKMQQVRRAAHAPAEPSSQDQRVAAEASAIESRARSELAAARRDSGAVGGRETAGNRRRFASDGVGHQPPGRFIDVVV